MNALHWLIWRHMIRETAWRAECERNKAKWFGDRPRSLLFLDVVGDLPNSGGMHVYANTERAGWSTVEYSTEKEEYSIASDVIRSNVVKMVKDR